MSSGSPNFISRNRGMLMLMAPIVAFLALFFAWPVVLVLGNSFGGDGGPIGEYIEFFTSNTYVRIVFRTIFVALLVTALCLLIGYPYAYLMVRTKGKMLAFLTGVVLLSFFTSVMVRSFAWIVMLQRNGIIDRIAQWLGFDGLVLRGSTTGVTIAMVQVMLPFMIFPLYSAMAGIDTRLERASTSLGATKWTTFRDIWFPLSMPGVIGGSVIVFVTSLGFYVIPGLVGSPSNQLLSHLIYSLINTVLNVPLASAASVVMLLMALLVVLPTMMRYDVTGSTTSRFASDEGRGGKQSIWLWIFGALVIALLLVPGLVVIPLSFPENRSFAFPPQGFSWQWYANFFNSRQWWGAFITSIQVAVLVTFTSTVLAVFAGLALRRSSTRVRTVIRALVLTPRIVPGGDHCTGGLWSVSRLAAEHHDHRFRDCPHDHGAAFRVHPDCRHAGTIRHAVRTGSSQPWGIPHHHVLSDHPAADQHRYDDRRIVRLCHLF